MKSTLLLPLAAIVMITAGAAQARNDAVDTRLQAVIASQDRPEADRARDRYRHPLQTLSFFGIKPDMTVVEIAPGGGWYSEILAPYLSESGHYYAAASATSLPTSSEKAKQGVAKFAARFDANPARYGKPVITEFQPPLRVEIAPAGSADLVVSFRNVHNWIASDSELAAFQSFFTALKPGGTLGIVEHRGKPGETVDQMKDTGYVSEAYVKALAQQAGFRFVASSPVNNNPKDSKDYPEGVWTLPPTLKLGDKDREKYRAIGESDRMTLKFIKPQ
ncbi:class I SAM-dependent methyltransferase [Hydrocarboniphaga sp.]|uniref:class I SAM-dependent methyltransferase n=1 Tax=Hydrocarboniphaga sp. TaxID=2033016 RepID=UPI003D0CC51A